ncbi:MAG: ArsR/SmtB family transcription factor [Sandaracinaceae bacterium]
MTTVQDATGWLGLLGDPSRVRLLALLADHELTVAELTTITNLAQSRVSTHLGRLRDAGVLGTRRAGASTYYRISAAMPEDARALWTLLAARLDDPMLSDDRARRDALVRERERGWPDAVAGQMERHYSPGRTWEATARGFLGLASFGDVLDAGSGDGTLAALIAPRARSVTCLDRSEKVLAAAQARLRSHENVRFARGDLAELPFEAASFDQVMLFNVLTFAHAPEPVLREAARVLRPGGRLAVVTLSTHEHAQVTEAYGHVRPGFARDELRELVEATGLTIDLCDVTSRERRKPYFEVMNAFAHKPR